MAGRTTLDVDEVRELASRACLACGASPELTASLVEASLSAHRHGRHEVGIPHFIDYLAALQAGRINGRAVPRLSRPFPAFFESDADAGIAQLGFDRAEADLIAAVQTFGIAIFTQRNSFSTGELGYYPRRLAAAGLVALAFTNANALLAPAPGLPRAYSTNPLAFAFPLGSDRPPVLIDQSSSATAFVNVIAAARRGEPLPEGIALDAAGRPTVSAAEALMGALLPFGGRKGANLALLVELMSAGLAGSNWSADAPDFQSGGEPLDLGLTVIALMPGADGPEAAARAARQVERLQAAGIHVPGQKREAATAITLDDAVIEALRSYLPKA